MFGRTKDQPELPLAVAGLAPAPAPALGDADRARLTEGLRGGGYGAISLLKSFRSVRSPLYGPACDFVLAALDARFHVPVGSGGRYYGENQVYNGGAFSITCSGWQPGARSFLQEVGVAWRHGIDPLPAA